MVKLNRAFWAHLTALITAASMWTIWLPLMRTLTGGDSYAWGTEFFNHMYRGIGLQGEYLFLVYLAILGVTLIFMGLRNPRAPYPALLVIWHGMFFANALYLPIIADRENIFYGDTGGLVFDLTIIAPVITGAAFLFSVIWAIAESRLPTREMRFGLDRLNVIYALVFLAYLAAVTVLERTGEAHGLTDQLVVPLNVLAPVLIWLVFYPWRTQRN